MTVYGRKEFPRGAARPKPTSSLLVLNYRVEDVKSNGGNQHDGNTPHLLFRDPTLNWLTRFLHSRHGGRGTLACTCTLISARDTRSVCREVANRSVSRQGESRLLRAVDTDPLEVRKATLASIVAKASSGIRFNEHIEGDGPTVFAHACKLGLEGIVSKRKDSAYRSGRSPDWFKMKNSACSAVKREEEEDWALTAPAGGFSAASHKTSTLRSPAVASSMIVLAMISSLRSRGRLIAARAVSNAMPRRRMVSGSKVWPFKKGLMGTRASSQGKLNQLLAAAPVSLSFKCCETKKRIKSADGNGVDVLVFRKQHATRGVTPALAGSTMPKKRRNNNRTRKSRRSRCGAICRRLYPWVTRPLYVRQVRL